MAVGTPAFMAPELLGGDNDGGRRGSISEGKKPQLPTGKHAHMLASKIDVCVVNRVTESWT